jgi:hypothetical protein
MKISRNFWPFGITLLLVAFAGGIATLVVIASSNNNELVSNNYYEQAIEYQQRIDGAERARLAGATVTYDAPAKRIVLSLGRGPVKPDAPVQVQLYRPSAAGLDQPLTLEPAPDGRQIADASQLQPGLWKIRASWTVGGSQYWLEGNLTNRVGMSTPPPAR